MTGMVVSESSFAILFLAGKARRLEAEMEVEQTKAIAVLEGLELAQDLGYGRVVVEIDFKSLVGPKHYRGARTCWLAPIGVSLFKLVYHISKLIKVVTYSIVKTVNPIFKLYQKPP